MKTYKFFQQYNWGPGWDGEIVVPDSAIFYNIIPDKTHQEWYILIPSNDINTLIKDKGCIQVQCYNLMGYTIVHLDNIAADNWPDVGKEEFNRIFTELFSNVYVYRYKQAEYNVRINKDAKYIDGILQTELIHPEVLLKCYRIKELWPKNEVHCSRVCVKDSFNLKDCYFIDESELKLYDIQPNSPDFSYERIEVLNNPLIYDTSAKLAFEKLI